MNPNNFPFETLLKGKTKKSNTEKWYPTPVETFRNALKIESDTEFSEVLIKNLSYNLQYLQFLQKELDELELSSVLQAMTIKTYVITAMSIIEGLFAYTVKKNHHWPERDKEEIITFKSNTQKYENEPIKTETTVYKVIPSQEIPHYEVNFQTLIQILHANKTDLGIDKALYRQTKRIKDIRNKIHLISAENDKDHDYNTFNNDIKTQTQKLLYEILTADAISSQPAVFEFLKITETNNTIL